MSEDDSGLGLKVHEDAYRELERERDEWKAKYIQQNKALGCEMMDPSGTIWDFASGLQRENVQLKREVAGWMAAAKQWRENAIKLTEQRDRLAEAALAVVDRWETPFWKQVEHTGVYIAALRKAVEEVKGGQP
jgi:hypothetical protein